MMICPSVPVNLYFVNLKTYKNLLFFREEPLKVMDFHLLKFILGYHIIHPKNPINEDLFPH